MAGSAEQIREFQEQIARHPIRSPDRQEESLSVLVFSLAGEQYALPVTSVREVSRVGPITPIPGTSPLVLGATGLRGDVLAVVDLHRLLGLERQALTADSRLLVLRHDKVTAAVIADQVADIVALPASALHPPPAATAEETLPFLQGIARDGEMTTRLLDPARLLEAVRHAR